MRNLMRRASRCAFSVQLHERLFKAYDLCMLAIQLTKHAASFREFSSPPFAFGASEVSRFFVGVRKTTRAGTASPAPGLGLRSGWCSAC